MLYSGLVSVTFRQLEPRAVVELAAACGLQAIEWGGDIHVPHGDLETARRVRRLTADYGLRVAAYGSYYRCGPDEAWQPVLETAVALDAPLIRVWAGDRPSAEAGDEYREALAADGRRIAQSAAAHGIAVAYEFHADTLTDTLPSTLALLGAAEGMRTLWQPPVGQPVEQQLDTLRQLLPWLANVHVFSWRGARHERLPLADGAQLWQPALSVLAGSGREHGVLLEFVAGDQPEQLRRDAATLHDWLQQTKEHQHG